MYLTNAFAKKTTGCLSAERYGALRLQHRMSVTRTVLRRVGKDGELPEREIPRYKNSLT